MWTCFLQAGVYFNFISGLSYHWLDIFFSSLASCEFPLACLSSASLSSTQSHWHPSLSLVSFLCIVHKGTEGQYSGPLDVKHGMWLTWVLLKNELYWARVHTLDRNISKWLCEQIQGQVNRQLLGNLIRLKFKMWLYWAYSEAFTRNLEFRFILFLCGSYGVVTFKQCSREQTILGQLDHSLLQHKDLKMRYCWGAACWSCSVQGCWGASKSYPRGTTYLYDCTWQL